MKDDIGLVLEVYHIFDLNNGDLHYHLCRDDNFDMNKNYIFEKDDYCSEYHRMDDRVMHLNCERLCREENHFDTETNYHFTRTDDEQNKDCDNHNHICKNGWKLMDIQKKTIKIRNKKYIDIDHIYKKRGYN